LIESLFIIGTCQTFVFGALIEYAVVCYMESNLTGGVEGANAIAAAKNNAAIRKNQKRLGKTLKLNDYPIGDESLPCTCEINQVRRLYNNASRLTLHIYRESLQAIQLLQRWAYSIRPYLLCCR
jgi:hypothetical protein